MPSVHRNKMALMTRLQKDSAESSANDITKNLFSLQFESALSEEEKELLHLRARSHAISVYQCAQATYFVEILREIRSASKKGVTVIDAGENIGTDQSLSGIMCEVVRDRADPTEFKLKNQLKNPNLKRTTRILQDDKFKDPLSIGILGCGRLGSQIAHCLLTYGKLSPNELFISSRRPETLEYLQQRGVDCYYDNIRLVTTVHVVFVCVLPSQVTGVADEIKEYLPHNTILYIPTSAIPLKRLRQMLDTTNIIQPEYWWPEENRDKPWNHSVNVNMALEKKDVVEKTCPISGDVSDQVILVNPKLAEVFVFAAVNMCADLGLSRQESLRALHISMFGESDRQPLPDKLTLADFGGADGGVEVSFPQFDLVQVAECTSYVTQKFTSSSELRQAFIKRYWQVFEEYLHVRIYGNTS